MTSAEYIIDSTNKTFTLPFRVKQFKISNSSLFDVYVKTSGGLATVTDFTFLVQANSDFTSPVIDEISFNTYTIADNFINPAKIVFHSDKVGEGNNTPYIPSRTLSGVTGYPATVPYRSLGATLNGIVGNILKSIRFDSLIPLYFMIKYNSLNNIRPTALIAGDIFSNNASVLGVVNPRRFDSLIQMNPYTVGADTDLYFVSRDTSLSTSDTITVMNYFSNSPIFNTRLSKLTPVLSTDTYYTFVKPPAFYYSISIAAQNLVSTYNVTITLTMRDFLLRNNIVIHSAVYSGIAVTSSTAYSLEPTMQLVGEYRELEVSVVVNSATNGLRIAVNVWDYEG